MQQVESPHEVQASLAPGAELTSRVILLPPHTQGDKTSERFEKKGSRDREMGGGRERQTETDRQTKTEIETYRID